MINPGRLLGMMGVALLLATTTVATPLLRWSGAEDKLLVGDEKTLSVMLDDTLDVRTVELRVAYDPEIIESLGGSPGSLFDGLDLYPGFTESDGSWYGYCVVLGADDWAQGPGELFRWSVKALAEGSTWLEAIEISLRPPGGGDYPEVALSTVNVDVGDLTATPPWSNASATIALAPNPFNPRVSVHLRPAVAGQGRLEILDLRGRRVACPWQGAWTTDVVTVTWDGRDDRGHALPGGCYHFCLVGSHGEMLGRARGTLNR